MFHGWLVAAAAFATLLLTVGVPFYGMPFFYDYFIREFGWSRAATTSGIAFATLLVQPLGGLFVHRFRPSRLIVFGAAMLCLSFVTFALNGGSLIVYYVAWCLFMAGYVASGPIPHQVILSQWFRKRRGFVMGMAYLGLGLGGAVSQKYVALPLIGAYGWRVTLGVIGALCLIAIPLVLAVVRDRPSDQGLYPDGDAAPPPDIQQAPHEFGYLLRQRSFWLLAFGSFCSIGAIGSINQHMKLLFQDAGLSAPVVANTTFNILISSLVGRVAMGWLADVAPKKYVMIAAYLFVALPIPLLYVIDRPGNPEWFAIVFGFGLGADYMLIPLMAAHLFGPNSLARTMGIILPVDSIGQTCFPFLLGLLHDQQGDYRMGLAIVAALALMGAAAISLLPGSKSRTDASPLPEPEQCATR